MQNSTPLLVVIFPITFAGRRSLCALAGGSTEFVSFVPSMCSAVCHCLLVPGPRCACSRSFRAMCRQEIIDFTKVDINVLWLSPTVFISAVLFSMAEALRDYEVDFSFRIRREAPWSLSTGYTGRTFDFTDNVPKACDCIHACELLSRG
jgi:hypothetical protein